MACCKEFFVAKLELDHGAGSGLRDRPEGDPNRLSAADYNVC